jgi:hypothetical protein
MWFGCSSLFAMCGLGSKQKLLLGLDLQESCLSENVLRVTSLARTPQADEEHITGDAPAQKIVFSAALAAAGRSRGGGFVCSCPGLPVGVCGYRNGVIYDCIICLAPASAADVLLPFHSHSISAVARITCPRALKCLCQGNLDPLHVCMYVCIYHRNRAIWRLTRLGGGRCAACVIIVCYKP